jgi:hypothetical protein
LLCTSRKKTKLRITIKPGFHYLFILASSSTACRLFNWMFVWLFANDNGDAASSHLPFWFGVSFFVVTLYRKLFRMNLSLYNLIAYITDLKLSENYVIIVFNYSFSFLNSLFFASIVAYLSAWQLFFAKMSTSGSGQESCDNKQ